MVNAGDKTLTFLSAVSRMTNNENQECDNLVRTSQCNSACERKLSERGIHVILISFRHQNDVNAILGFISISIGKYRSRKPRFQYQHREVKVRSILWYRVDRGSPSTMAAITAGLFDKHFWVVISWSFLGCLGST